MIFSTENPDSAREHAQRAKWNCNGIVMRCLVWPMKNGRWRDNVFIERIRKSIKYEEIYLHAHSLLLKWIRVPATA